VNQVRVHEENLIAVGEILPRVISILLRRIVPHSEVAVVAVVDVDLARGLAGSARPGRRKPSRWGDPVCVRVVEDRIRGIRQRSVSDGVLVAFPFLVRPDERNQVVVPPGGIAWSFFGNDPQHVRQIVESIDGSLDVGVLQIGNGVGRGHAHGADRGRRRAAPVAVVDAIDIVGPRERVAVAGTAETQEEFAGEQVHAGIDPRAAQGLHPRAQPFKISLVELRQIELQASVGRQSGPRSLPGMRADREIRRRGLRARQAPEFRQLDTP